MHWVCCLSCLMLLLCCTVLRIHPYFHYCRNCAASSIIMPRRRVDEEREVYVCVADSVPPDLTELAFLLHL